MLPMFRKRYFRFESWKGSVEMKMSNPDRNISLLVILLLVALVAESRILRAETSASAQGIRTAAADEATRGIGLYQQGQNEEAIKVLRDAAKRYNNLRAWHYLGLALEKKGKTKDARKAHEQAAKLGEALVESQMEQVRTFDDYARLMNPISAELAEAGLSAQRYLALEGNPSRSKREQWTLRAETLLGFEEMAKGGPDAQLIFKSSQVDVKARILSKPEATYTEEARRRMVKGTVVVRAILAANGRVLGVVPIRTLPAGLTGQSLRAARQIRFIPAMKDGKPVSVSVQVEYNFNIY